MFNLKYFIKPLKSVEKFQGSYVDIITDSEKKIAVFSTAVFSRVTCRVSILVRTRDILIVTGAINV